MPTYTEKYDGFDFEKPMLNYSLGPSLHAYHFVRNYMKILENLCTFFFISKLDTRIR